MAVLVDLVEANQNDCALQFCVGKAHEPNRKQVRSPPPHKGQVTRVSVSNTGSEHDTTEETDRKEWNETAHSGCIGGQMNLLVPTTWLHGPR